MRLSILPFLAWSAIASSISQINSTLEHQLGPRLSPDASIVDNLSGSPRWSDYGAPQPGYVVNVATADDVAVTVRYCDEHGINFLAQGGAHSSPTTFHIGSQDVVINMAGLKEVVVNDNNTLTVGAGLVLGEVAQAANNQGSFAVTGACNCVGIMGLTLGGGLSFYQGKYGMTVDQVQSYQMVTSKGNLLHVSPTIHPDLFWALGGAGPNFGIVTSATIAIHPSSNLNVWSGYFTFRADQLPQFISAVGNLTLESDMAHVWQYTWNATLNQGFITSEAQYVGVGPGKEGRTQAKDAFRALFDLGPDSFSYTIEQYEHVGDVNDAFCTTGERKPSWHVGVKELDYPSWQGVWDTWESFIKQTNLTDTRILVESFSNQLSRRIGQLDRVSYPHRAINYHAIAQAIYDDSSLDEKAEQWGNKTREIWRSHSGFEPQRTYVNFAHGDETLEQIYGDSLPRLRGIKKRWDPENNFNQWFPIV